VRFLTGTAGTITDTYTYDAFGMPIATTGTTPNPYLYSGERFDSNLSLYHLRGRYYNPATGRFETMDPRSDCACEACRADPLGLHKYLYAASDPVNRIDPTGRADVAESYLIYAVFFTGAVATYYGTHPQQSQAVVTSIAALGQRTECELAKAACNLTSLADWWRYRGGHTARIDARSAMTIAFRPEVGRRGHREPQEGTCAAITGTSQARASERVYARQTNTK
jgi:RHS repeat-associated protein